LISKPHKWFSRLLLALLFGLVLSAGCVAVPIGSTSDEPVPGRKIRPEDVAFIQPGITTREELISRLGAPTFDLPDLGILSYVWLELKEDWAVIWAIPTNPPLGGGAVVIPRTADWALFAAIDENGRVVRVGLDQRKLYDSVRSQARKWAEAQGLKLPPVQSAFASLPVPAEKALIYFYRTKPPSSLAGFLGLGGDFSLPFPIAVSIDDQYVTEMHDDTYAAIPILPGRHEFVIDPAPPYWYIERGALAVSPSQRRPAKLIVEAVAGQQYFLEVRSSTSGMGRIDTSLTLRNESDAQPSLRTFRPVW